ncbi:hypothetical protein GOBAR_DD30023 [Gossypium barbadense]|nr:hypothetical protein GOBAR_DD30023 [Gossypium barbadense]
MEPSSWLLPRDKISILVNWYKEKATLSILPMPSDDRPLTTVRLSAAPPPKRRPTKRDERLLKPGSWWVERTGFRTP